MIVHTFMQILLYSKANRVRSLTFGNNKCEVDRRLAVKGYCNLFSSDKLVDINYIRNNCN